jgi:hypothetical protein
MKQLKQWATVTVAACSQTSGRAKRVQMFLLRRHTVQWDWILCHLSLGPSLPKHRAIIRFVLQMTSVPSCGRQQIAKWYRRAKEEELSKKTGRWFEWRRDTETYLMAQIIIFMIKRLPKIIDTVSLRDPQSNPSLPVSIRCSSVYSIRCLSALRWQQYHK